MDAELYMRWVNSQLQKSDGVSVFSQANSVWRMQPLFALCIISCNVNCVCNHKCWHGCIVMFAACITKLNKTSVTDTYIMSMIPNKCPNYWQLFTVTGPFFRDSIWRAALIISTNPLYY